MPEDPPARVESGITFLIRSGGARGLSVPSEYVGAIKFFNTELPMTAVQRSTMVQLQTTTFSTGG